MTMPAQAPQTDWSSIRRSLAARGGESIWRSLDELEDSRSGGELIGQEFPEGLPEWDDGVSRRNFLRLMGASLALAGGGAGCSKRPIEQIVPYVNSPEQIVAGVPLHFATASSFGGYGRGIIVESHEGRPTKIEGNPDHPASLGGTDIFMQATILDLYDPDRAQVLTHGANVSAWGDFVEAIGARLEAERGRGGAGLALLSGTITSPTVVAQIAELLQQFPSARWHCHEPAGAQISDVSAVHNLDKAEVILALDSDFLFGEPLSLRYARQFSDGRRVRRDPLSMNRLYVVESTPTLTGSMADHRLSIRPSQLPSIVAAIWAYLSHGPSGSELPANVTAWAQAVAEDLRAAQSSLVIAGPWQSSAVHDLARAMNQFLGNEGKTVQYFADVRPRGAQTLAQLAADMASGATNTLIILDSNPAYTAPADLKFKELLESFSTAQQNGQFTNFTACLGVYTDESAMRCQWHIPLSHELESWGDLLTPDGIASIVQPLIAPLYSSKSICEVMEALLGRPQSTGYEIVRAHWMRARQNEGASAFERWWESALQRGVAGEASPPLAVSQPPTPAKILSPKRAPGSLELLIRPDPCIWDGSRANNGWLQELPNPFTKLTWDNAALIGPKLAESMTLQDGDIVTLQYRGRSIDAPVLILPGQADQTVTVHLGYGRSHFGRVAFDESKNQTRGYNAYALRTTDAPWGGGGLTLEKTGGRSRLAITRSHHAMDPLTVRGELRPEAVETPSTPPADVELENRRLVRVSGIEEFRRNPDIIHQLGGDKEKRTVPLTLYAPADKEWDYAGHHKWGMSIDLNSCIGCNACVIACQAENNIPVVGKDQVGRGREMHWIRVDDYFAGDLENPRVYHQPVPCMHCENAPCELVCPVGATTHSAEGINEMTYNRCIGTRYCSNNCPYKVRRFNFLNYQQMEPSLALQRNPEVTVRSRGVMEKCNYCLQRVTRSRIDLEKSRVEIEDQARRAPNDQERQRLLKMRDQQQEWILNTLQTACQQACPTQAIVFGDLNDWSSHGGKGSLVRQLKAEPLDYGLLVELTTKPRTTYLARLENPNPALNAGGTRQ
jgi:molybdopterin-containing oxidoreductase family iron-sulfur binding subunit